MIKQLTATATALILAGTVTACGGGDTADTTNAHCADVTALYNQLERASSTGTDAKTLFDLGKATVDYGNKYPDTVQGTEFVQMGEAWKQTASFYSAMLPDSQLAKAELAVATRVGELYRDCQTATN